MSESTNPFLRTHAHALLSPSKRHPREGYGGTVEIISYHDHSNTIAMLPTVETSIKARQYHGGASFIASLQMVCGNFTFWLINMIGRPQRAVMAQRELQRLYSTGCKCV